MNAVYLKFQTTFKTQQQQQKNPPSSKPLSIKKHKDSFLKGSVFILPLSIHPEKTESLASPFQHHVQQLSNFRDH